MSTTTVTTVTTVAIRLDPAEAARAGQEMSTAFVSALTRCPEGFAAAVVVTIDGGRITFAPDFAPRPADACTASSGARLCQRTAGHAGAHSARDIAGDITWLDPEGAR